MSLLKYALREGIGISQVNVVNEVVQPEKYKCIIIAKSIEKFEEKYYIYSDYLELLLLKESNSIKKIVKKERYFLGEGSLEWCLIKHKLTFLEKSFFGFIVISRNSYEPNRLKVIVDVVSRKISHRWK